MNHTLVTEFLFVRWTESWVLSRLHAAFFSLLYLVAMWENVIIIFLTVLDRHLHTPMYFFLRHLSFLDLCLISATVPKSILNSVTFTDSISFLGCAVQLFLVVLMAGSEIGILTAMSYDHYVAICRPLHYEAVMSKGTSVLLTAVSWLNGGALGILYSTGTFSLKFCGSNQIHQFFCDVPALLKLTCSEQYVTIHVGVAIGVCYAFSCLVCIMVSYMCIFSTVLKIPTRQKQSKAFSTCLPHLIVLCMFLLTGAVAYLKPASGTSGQDGGIGGNTVPPLTTKIKDNKYLKTITQPEHRKLKYGSRQLFNQTGKRGGVGRRRRGKAAGKRGGCQARERRAA